MAVAEISTTASATLNQCPACGADWMADRMIRIPLAEESADEMLGDSLRQRLHELTYDRCARCRSLIATDLRRDPRMLEEIYRQLPQTYWQGLNEQLGLHAEIERQLRRRGVHGGELWDIGCGSGNVLERFGPQWAKSGIEPGLEAVAQARGRGLNVVAGTASGLRLRNVADAAISIDVVEHLPEPETELLSIREMLRPGGVLLLLTGMADAWTARFAGTRWYYLHCIGHVTVFSGAALSARLKQLGFVNVATHRIEHPSAVGLLRWIKRISGNTLRRALGKRPAPMHCYRDHQLVVASKAR
jgi:SAM-dependent methyltransferase